MLIKACLPTNGKETGPILDFITRTLNGARCPQAREMIAKPTNPEYTAPLMCHAASILAGWLRLPV